MKNADDASESHRPVRRVRRNREKVVGHVLAFRAPERIPDPQRFRDPHPEQFSQQTDSAATIIVIRKPAARPEAIPARRLRQ